MTLPLNEAKDQAKRIMTRLTSLGVAIQHTQALEAVAAAHNFSDWNRFKANLDTSPSESGLGSEIENKLAQDGSTRASYDVNRVIVMRPGEGKTTTLLLCAEAVRMASKDSVTLLINCNPQRSQVKSGYDELPERLKKEITQVKAFHSPDGQIDKWETIPQAGVRTIYLEFHSTGKDSHGDTGTDRAICNLPHSMVAAWPSSVYRNIQLLLVDEFSYISRTSAPSFFRNTLWALYRLSDKFATGHRGVIIATQGFYDLLEVVDHLLSGRFDFITTTASFQRDLAIRMDSNERLMEIYKNSRIFFADLGESFESGRPASKRLRAATDVVAQMTVAARLNKDPCEFAQNLDAMARDIAIPLAPCLMELKGHRY